MAEILQEVDRLYGGVGRYLEAEQDYLDSIVLRLRGDSSDRQ